MSIAFRSLRALTLGIAVTALLACSEEDETPTLELSMPVSADGLFTSSAGEIFAAEGFNGTRVFRIQADGTTEVFADGLSGPIDMAEGSDGAIYVTNFGSASVSRIDRNGQVSRFATVEPFPSGIVAAPDGSLFVAHYGAADSTTGLGTGNSILRISPAGDVTTLSRGDKLQAPVGLDLGPDGTLYAANFHEGEILAIDANGAQTVLTDFEDAPVGFGVGHLVLARGAIFCTLISRAQIFRVELSAGDAPTEVQGGISQANGITVEPGGANLLVSAVNGGESLFRVSLP
ncbi:MAG: hypothetical protein AAFZ18_10590 [Myxococcota bacterium]